MIVIGAIVLKEEEFSTPWSHFIGLGYDDNNPALPPGGVNPVNLNTSTKSTPHHHNHHHHAHQHIVTIAANTNAHGLSIHSPSVMNANTNLMGINSTKDANNSAHNDITSILNNTGIPKYLQYEGRIKHMFLSKWETETCVNEVWDAKEELASRQVKQEQTNGFAHDFDPTIVPDISFAEFYWEFIEVSTNAMFCIYE